MCLVCRLWVLLSPGFVIRLLLFLRLLFDHQERRQGDLHRSLLVWIQTSPLPIFDQLPSRSAGELFSYDSANAEGSVDVWAELKVMFLLYCA